MKSLFSFLLISLLVVGCKKEGTTETLQVAEKTILDVPYGTDEYQKMDVHLPANRNTTDTKILILIHGGAWSSGDKTDFDEYVPVFKKRLPGYAIFNINYRLAVYPSTNAFPTQENDVKAAVAHILSKADEYRFNKEKMAVLGASAGGHLALLQSYKNSSPKVKAVVDMFGPTDMVALYISLSNQFEKTMMQALMGGTPATNPTLYRSSSPVYQVGAQSPATLILHGSLDPLVPILQSTALKTRLEGAGVPVQMVTYPNEGHGWFGASLTDSYNKIVDFLNLHNP